MGSAEPAAPLRPRVRAARTGSLRSARVPRTARPARPALAAEQATLRRREASPDDPAPAETTGRAASLTAVGVAACSSWAGESDWAVATRAGRTRAGGAVLRAMQKLARPDAVQWGRRSASLPRVGCAWVAEEADSRVGALGQPQAGDSGPAAEAVAVARQTEDDAVAVVDPNYDSQSLLVLHMLIGCPTQTTPLPNLGEKASFFGAKGRSATVFAIGTVVFRCHGFRGCDAREAWSARVSTRPLTGDRAPHAAVTRGIAS
jgi:hypothetical protein